jgi:dUTP pyrophosphatase
MVCRALRCAPMGAPIEIPLVRLDPDLPLPAYARSGDAGADLCAREGVTLGPGGGRAVVPTGVAVAIPPGHAGFVLPRSGLALKHGVTVLNSPGLIDAGYRDELRVVLVNTDPTAAYEIHRGDRIAQLVIQPVEACTFVEVGALDGENRGGGFGHTGR